MGNCEKCRQSLLFKCNHQCTFGSIIFPQNNIKMINIMIIGDKNNEEVKKLTRHFQNHYFRDKITYLKNSTYYYDSKYTLKVSYSDFDNLNNIKQIGFDLIVSYEKTKENNIIIIKYFGKTHYILKNICQKEELLIECSNLISLGDLELTNDFTKAISVFFSWDIKTHSSINDSNINKIERIKQYFICPIGGDIMRDPVSTPNGHIFERSNIEEEIKRRGKCPLTGKELKIEDLRPVLPMKNLLFEIHNKNMSKEPDSIN